MKTKQIRVVYLVLLLIVVLSIFIVAPSASEGTSGTRTVVAQSEPGTTLKCTSKNTDIYSEYTWIIYDDGELVVESTGGTEIRPFSSSGISIGSAVGNLSIDVGGAAITGNNFIKKITLKGFTRLEDIYGSPFGNWAALETVDLGEIDTLFTCGVRGFMRRNLKLATVGTTANSGTLETGVVNLSCIKNFVAFNASGDNYPFGNYGDPSYAFFYNCDAIKKVILPEIKSLSTHSVDPNKFYEGMFYSCDNLEEVVVPYTLYDINGNMTLSASTFVSCPKLKRIVFESPNSVKFPEGYTLPDTVTEIVCYTDTVKANLTASGISAAKITVEAPPAKFLVTGTISSTNGTSPSTYDYTFNKLSGELLLECKSGKSFDHNGGFSALRTEYKAVVTSIKLVGFTELVEYWGSPLSYWTNLETIDLGSIDSYWVANGDGAFVNDPKLTTVGSSVYGTLKDGVVDISTITGYRAGNLFRHFNNMFSGSSSIKKIILPTLKNEAAFVDPDDNDANVTATEKGENIGNRFYKDMFAGCTALEEIVIPSTWSGAVECKEYVNNDGDGQRGYVETSVSPLAACTALKRITVNSKTVTFGADLIPEKNGLTVVCYSQTTADSLAGYEATKVINFGGVIKADAFQIRTNKSTTARNGLRTLYTFDTVRRDTLVGQGLIFKEYGAIVISKNKLGSGSIGLTKNGDDYVVNNKGAVKIPIFIGNEQMNKILLDQDGDTTTIEFAVTLVNIPQVNYTSDIYSCGYAIFVDTDGNEYIEYANYGTENRDYEYVNIFDLAMNMCVENSITASASADEEPVWGILGYNAISLEREAREISVGENASMIVSVNGAGEKILFVRDLSGNEPTQAQINAAEQKAAELSISVAKTVALKIVDDPDFVIKTQWEAYLDACIEGAALTESEKKKSFVFVTDTHWTSTEASDAEQNLTNAISYVSDALGGALVIHGGDLYAGGFTNGKETAAAIIDSYFESQLEKEFGGNYLYALGNHCTNVQGYINAGGQASGLTDAEKEVIRLNNFISDKDMYDMTVGRSDAGMGAGKIVYDEAGIARIKELLTYYKDHPDELHEPAVNDHNITAKFEVTDYLITEAENLMKMHYHYDDETAGVRYIVLDTGGRGYAQDRIFNDQATTFVIYQYKWLAETLKSTPAGYDVVVVGHQISATGTTLGDTSKNIYNIMSAFKTGGTVSTTENNWQKWNMVAQTLQTEAKLTNYSYDTAFDGNIIVIGGHHHADYGFYVGNGVATNVQFGSGDNAAAGEILSITTGTPVRGQDSHKDADGVAIGTEYPENMRFDVVTLCDDGSVKVTRIGAGQSREWTYNKQ